MDVEYRSWFYTKLILHLTVESIRETQGKTSEKKQEKLHRRKYLNVFQKIAFGLFLKGIGTFQNIFWEDF
jgi:hypothetical protein